MHTVSLTGTRGQIQGHLLAMTVGRWVAHCEAGVSLGTSPPCPRPGSGRSMLLHTGVAAKHMDTSHDVKQLPAERLELQPLRACGHDNVLQREAKRWKECPQ